MRTISSTIFCTRIKYVCLKSRRRETFQGDKDCQRHYYKQFGGSIIAVTSQNSVQFGNSTGFHVKLPVLNTL